MSDDQCQCGSCQADGYYDQSFYELRERLKALPLYTMSFEGVTYQIKPSDRVAQQPASIHDGCDVYIAALLAAIDELTGLIGYLPQAHAVLEKHGLR